MESEWISAASAYEQVSRANGPYLAGRAICGRAFAGLVEARTELLLWGSERRESCGVPPEFWWAKGEAALTQDWSLGDFKTWIDRRIQCRAFGVEFKNSDIERMLPRGKSLSFIRSEPGNYASASKCMAELRSSLGYSETDAERLIIRNCRLGILPSRCANITTRTRDRYGENVEELGSSSIPDWFWEHCVDSEAVLDWGRGRLAGRGVVDGDERKVRIDGVEFEVAAIVELEAIELRAHKEGRDEQATAEPTNASLKPPNLRALGAKWPDWIAELVSEVHDHGFPPGIGSQGQEELIQRVANSLAKLGIEGPGRSTVQAIVQAALDRHRSAGK